MKIAYLILAHDQPGLFIRLASALRCGEAHIYAHIDRKIDQAEFQCPGVHFVADRTPVNHGGFSQVLAMLELLRAAAISQSDYFIFLSGRDYPIASNREIVATLSADTSRIYMNRYLLGPAAHLHHNITRWYFVDELARLPPTMRRGLRLLLYLLNGILPGRRFPAGWVPYRGSTSWYLPRPAVDWILRAAGERPDFVKFFRRANCPDEIFFQTLVYNRFRVNDAGAAKNEIKFNLHHIDWNPTRENPAILDMRDYEILSNGHNLFARKFDVRRSGDLLDALDQRRLSRDFRSTTER
jgi:hypothetical protein